jgi:predicted 2-oxoglutarate/Fe(II)-dependent dioxygenase YbiX
VTDRALPLACYGARVLAVDGAGVGVLARLRALLPAQAHVGEAAEPDVRYDLRAGVPGDPAGAAFWEVARNGQPRFRATTVEAVARWLRSDIDHQVAVHARGVLFAHAGVVGWRGRAILVPGRSMTGKSTLVAELVRRGARYYSDEYAVIDDRGQVHPYTRPLSLRNGAGLGRAAPDEALEAITGLEPLSPALIVSTAYREGVAWCPVAVTGARAALPLVDNTVLASAEPARTVRLAAMLAPSVVMLQGLRPDAELVAPRILEFVDDLLDGRHAPDPGGAAIGSRPWGSAYDAPPSRPRTRNPGEAGPSDAPRYRARYLRIEDVLGPAEHARLLEYAGGHETEFQPGKVFPAGVSGAGVVDPELRRARDKRMIEPVWDLFEPRLRELLLHVRQTLGIPWFPLAGIERRLVAHADGDFFGIHTDNGRPSVATRRITAVYYFHAMPKRFSGGELRLYDGVLRDGRIEPASTYTELEPLDNSLVFFPSEVFHEVRPVRASRGDFRESRFTVNIWYRAVEPSAIHPGAAADTPDSPPATAG